MKVLIRMFFTESPFKAMSDGKTPGYFIRYGAYNYTRHPFYFGFLLCMIGILLIFPSIISMVWLGLYILLTYKAIAEEEKKLEIMFGNAYLNYVEHTPKLFPVKIHKLMLYIVKHIFG